MARNFNTEKEIQYFVLEFLKSNNGYKHITMENENQHFDLMIKELERINNLKFSEPHIIELKRKILNKNNTETSYKFAEYLLGRDTIPLKIDSNKHLRPKFIDWENWENNHFYISDEVPTIGEKDRRIDLLISINGIPFIAIELKKQSKKIEKAIDQLSDYKNDTFGSGIYRFVQVLVGSNFDEVKMWANNKNQNKSFAFNWFNKNSRNLEEFVKDFLNKENLRRYFKETGFLFEFVKKETILLRPYQEQAVNKIINFVKEKISSDNLDILNSENNGYVWHTTGSGKTLTSFKAAKLLSEIKQVDKVLFLLDRKDLTDQTSLAFKNMYKDSDAQNDFSMFNPATSFELEKIIVKEKFIVTTIQKMNKLLSRDNKQKINEIKNKNIVFIIDECHRSVSGQMAQRVRNYFKQAIMIGLSGTPIFESNSNFETNNYFGKRLHTYNILDAIKDKNVLGFFVRQYSKPSGNGQYDEKDSRYIEAVKNVIKENHANFTQNGAFNAIFAFNTIDTMLEYYESFLELENQLFMTPIFSSNFDNADFNSDLEDDEDEIKEETNVGLREKQRKILERYNKKFNTNFSLDQDGFNRYIFDARAKFKKGEIEIILVVNMLLTGYDSPKTNTLYVIKKMEKHNLIQAFSRTNRIFNKAKKHGLIINFSLEKHTINDAIAIYSNKNIDEVKSILIGKTYKELHEELNKYAKEVRKFLNNQDGQNALNFETITQEEMIDKKEILSQFLKVASKFKETIDNLKTFEEYDQDKKQDDDSLLQSCLEKSKKIKELFNNTKDKSKFDDVISNESFDDLILIEKEKIRIDYNYILSILNSTKMQDILVSEKVSSKNEMLDKITEWKEAILLELKQDKNENKINLKEYQENKFMVEIQFDFFTDNIKKWSKDSYSKKEFIQLKKDAIIYMLEMRKQKCLDDIITKYNLEEEMFLKIEKDFNARINHEQIDPLPTSKIVKDFFENKLSNEDKSNFINTYQEELNSYFLMAELMNKLEEVY